MKLVVNCHDIAKRPSIPMTYLQSCAKHHCLLLLNHKQCSFHSGYRSCSTWMVGGENCVHDFSDTAYRLMVLV
jgi:hypothetical protein